MRLSAAANKRAMWQVPFATSPLAFPRENGGRGKWWGWKSGRECVHRVQVVSLRSQRFLCLDYIYRYFFVLTNKFCLIF